jgi:iron uptake system EfeUOB component EfeO/EfeM
MGIMDVNSEGGPYMKNIKLFSSLLIAGLLLGGCGGNDNAEEVKEVTPDEESQPATSDGKPGEDSSNQKIIIKGVGDTISSVEELSKMLSNNPDDAKKLNEQGSKIEEKWDKIEKTIENNFPEDYENIEKSLYPLIAEAKKDTPDPDNLNKLTEDTSKKLDKFLEKVKNQ